MSELHEECGVFGIYTPEVSPVATDAYYGLFALQHRGQDSAGIVVNNDGLFSVKKDEGLVSSVFTAEALSRLGEGTMAVGHVRAATAETRPVSNAQPLVVNHVKGHIAIAHNGCLVNAAELRHELEMGGAIFHMTSDIEIIAYLIIKERLTAPSIEEAVNRAVAKMEGSFSLVIMSPSKLIAVRDPHAIRPLCLGKRNDGAIIVASESCALSAVSADFVRDLAPGEIVVIDGHGTRSLTDHCDTVPKKSCVFEYIYLARPDSNIDGVNVHWSRVKAGECLAEDAPVEADLVIGVPDSGIDAAIGYSKKSGIPYEMGFTKSRYIARTFIAPTQKLREKGVRMKLSAMRAVIEGKRVVMVDDSIVRGTTCAQIINLLREAGAREVHVRISSPPFINPCYYGTDIDSKDKLIACRMTQEQICASIGADSLAYLGIDRLGDVAQCPQGCGYCDACFTANYPTAEPPVMEKSKYETGISSKK